jgi:NAD(P)-dependent dehydrogenase (short-subunit alcohol dehydrogenase family)
LTKASAEFGCERSELFARTTAQLPVGRIGTSEDVAQMILALMTNGFMIGATVFIDGGGMLV